jgi:low affinity Fe/Cu permease
VSEWFSNFTRKISNAAGTWQASLSAFLIILLWLIGGFFFGFLDPVYQLVINTFTTCVTFIMVFLIQSASNRDQKALQIKLNDLLCSISKANEQLIDIEESTDEQIEAARQQMSRHKPNQSGETEKAP